MVRLTKGGGGVTRPSLNRIRNSSFNNNDFMILCFIQIKTIKFNMQFKL